MTLGGQLAPFLRGQLAPIGGSNVRHYTETDRWFYLADDTTAIPSNNIDLYSERKDGSFGPGYFEPREAVKGDVARAVLYFYTMYKEEADAADPDYFDMMKNTLLLWHNYDPVDSIEYIRNILKSNYQEGKMNPFILDCTLAHRGYSDGVQAQCDTSHNSSTDNYSYDTLKVYPIPASDYLTIQHPESDKPIRITVSNFNGTMSLTLNTFLPTIVNISHLDPGKYYLRMYSGSKIITVVSFIKT